MSDFNSEIKSAIDAFDLDKARSLLREAMKDADGETYYLASKVALDDEQKEEFLEKAIELDPFHENARKALKKETTSGVHNEASRSVEKRKPQQPSSVNNQNALQQAIWTAVFAWTGASFFFSLPSFVSWFTYGESNFYFWYFIGYITVGLIGGYGMGIAISKLDSRFTDEDTRKLTFMVGGIYIVYYFLRQIDTDGEFTWMFMNVLGDILVGTIIWYHLKEVSTLKIDTNWLTVAAYFAVFGVIAIIVFQIIPDLPLPTDRTNYLPWMWGTTIITLLANFIGAIVAMNLLFKHFHKMVSDYQNHSVNVAT